VTNRRAIGAAVAVALALAIPPVTRAPAQQPPTSLLPPALGQAVPAPQGRPLEPLQPVPAVPAAPVVPPVPSASQPLPPAPGAGSLGTIPAGSLGVIPQDAIGALIGGAFDETLAMFDAPLPAPALQRAARELLIDRAFAETSGAMARARALYALGLAEDAAGAAITRESVSVAERAMAARALLAVGQYEQACRRADVESLPKDAEPEPTFALLEVLAYCKLEQGTRDAALLIANLLREQGGGDALFFAALKLASEGAGSLPEADKVPAVRPVHLALMRRAGVAVPADYVMRADPALLALIARSDSLDPAARIAAGERMVEIGLAPAGSLVGLYGTTPLDERMLMQAASGVAPAGPLARAHLFALIAEAASEAERIGFISTLYAQARQAGVDGAIAEAIGEDAAGIAPDPSLGSAALLMVEILVRGDRARAAIGWVDAGEFPGPDGRPALSRFDAHRNRALIAVLDPELGLGVAAGALGADAGGGALSQPQRDFVAAEVAVMSALGDFVPPMLVSIAERPSPAIPARSAAEVLEAIAPLASADPGEVDTATLARAVGALSSYGLAGEARLLAAEALIRRGRG